MNFINSLKMKNLYTLIFIMTFIFQSCKEKNNLENSLWKFSDGPGYISDVLAFNSEYLYTRIDSIFFHKSDTLVGIVDTITLHYGERRLYIKDLKGNVGRYCEQ